MRTFCVQVLGCKVNQYEAEQIATLLRSRGLSQVDSPAEADLRVVHTCSVTIQAASKSRQAVRRLTRLPVLNDQLNPRTIVTGCWATSNQADASSLPGVDSVITNHQDVASEIDRLLNQWETSGRSVHDTPASAVAVKKNATGTVHLPMLGEQRQTTHQRAFLKIQDGCDAHCTYCIIPHLRPTVWSKPIDAVVEEAKRLVDAGHGELVLTGIFLGAYEKQTALRRRQVRNDACDFASLIESLCRNVRGLKRLRLSSLEPGDLTSDLISVLKSHRKLVPHFHLPLQSGSDTILRKMNRQYTRDDFLRMIDRVNAAFDRPAITTDIIVGFPGETDAEFERALEVVDQARFIHTHAFSFSPRPGTAAARWKDQFVHGPVVNERIELLNERAKSHSYEFRKQFLGETVEVLVERSSDPVRRHGRSERYFDVEFADDRVSAGELAPIQIERVEYNKTVGRLAAVPEGRL
jgi:threonylcarbamoyladenosine tRNA methylthiotransferase MtaB